MEVANFYAAMDTLMDQDVLVDRLTQVPDSRSTQIIA